MSMSRQEELSVSTNEFKPVGAFAFFLSLLVFFAVIWVAIYAWMYYREFY
jgi:hypothetical protein